MIRDLCVRSRQTPTQRAARATVVLVLINYADLDANRGAGLKNLAKVLIALFGSPEAGGAVQQARPWGSKAPTRFHFFILKGAARSTPGLESTNPVSKPGFKTS